MMSSLSTRQAAPRSYYLLVVDDDETVRELLGIQLKRDGHRVCEAADAPSATI